MHPPVARTVDKCIRYPRRRDCQIDAKNSDRANHYHGEIFKGAKSEMGNLVSTFTVLNDTEEMFVYRAHNVLDKFQLTKGLELKNLGLDFVPAAVRIFKELIRLCN